MTPVSTQLPVTDVVIWLKHIRSDSLREFLSELEPDEEITLQADNVSGRWRRMRTGRDGRPVMGLRPVGAMKEIWGDWFRTRKGEVIELRSVAPADDLLAATAPLFSEWASAEDEAAFSDL